MASFVESALQWSVVILLWGVAVVMLMAWAEALPARVTSRSRRER